MLEGENKGGPYHCNINIKMHHEKMPIATQQFRRRNLMFFVDI